PPAEDAAGPKRQASADIRRPNRDEHGPYFNNEWKRRDFRVAIAAAAAQSEPARDGNEVGRPECVAAMIAGRAADDDRPAVGQARDQDSEEAADERRCQ